ALHTLQQLGLPRNPSGNVRRHQRYNPATQHTEVSPPPKPPPHLSLTGSSEGSGRAPRPDLCAGAKP
ncbi:unnamed protein product, partial [Musa acuminata var. zebrina]